MPEQFLSDRLEWINESIKNIQNYITNIKSAQDFNTSSGLMVYDTVLMRPQVIGENIKTIHKHYPVLFDSIDYEVSSIIRFREIISHHYEKLNTEIVLDIYNQYLPKLNAKVEALLNSIK
ncbi:MAG: DUF86 domain-containing protein [Chitinophagaceae bacterium]|nr:DUF86 domain-containing protein [Chitinophagaceae bacterium]